MKLTITLLPRAIRRELMRLAADGFTVQNLGDGHAVLLRNGTAESCRWHGPAREMLDRLRALPDAAGPDAVAAAFASDTDDSVG